MNGVARLLLLFAIMVLAAGCGPQVKKAGTGAGGAAPAGEVQGAPESQTGGSGAATRGLWGGREFTPADLTNPDSPLSQRVIYFELDSSVVGEEYRDMLDAHGSFLAQNPNVQVTVEGHADERGSREYNIGLGDRRAQAVRRMLLFQGAAADQADVVSYGEERPASFGQGEESWRLNRRVELNYPGY